MNSTSSNASRGSTPAIRLRPIETADLDWLFEQQLDPESCRMAVVNPRSAEVFYPLFARVLTDENVTARAILADEQPVGSVSCFVRDDRRYVGYWLDRRYWGRGIATQAVQLLLREVIARPLHARVARSNAASIRVLEKCGFVVSRYAMHPGDERFPACEEALLVLG